MIYVVIMGNEVRSHVICVDFRSVQIKAVLNLANVTNV